MLYFVALVALLGFNNVVSHASDVLVDNELGLFKNRGDCGTERIVFEPRNPFCVRNLLQPECTYLELDKPACKDFPCSGDLKMRLNVITEEPRSSCCRNCQCWGDPHCKSFSNHTESWILCDARKPSPKKDHCSMNKNICKKQKDYFGKKCVWRTLTDNGKKPKKWIVGLYGSQCTFNGPAPEINMYSFDGFSMDITMGERGIITKAKMQIKDNTYTLDAKKCFETDEPWETETPDLIERHVLKTGDVRWIIDDDFSGMSAVILCTRNKINGVLGDPRLNIEDLIDPNMTRENSQGFCVSDKLDKGLSHDNDRTKWIQDNTLCRGDNNAETTKMGKQICGTGTNVKNIDECVENWCKNNYLDHEICLGHIENHSLRKTWCAVHTMVSKNPEECSENCQQCFDDLGDFGLRAGMETWRDFLTDRDRPCLTYNDLKENLEECEQGIELQYFDDESDTWNTYKAIPQYYSLCSNVTFTSSENSVMFNKKIRLKQCSVDSKCVRNRCKPEQGFSATISFRKAPDMCPCVDQEYENF